MTLPISFDYYTATTFEQSTEFVIQEILKAIPQASHQRGKPQTNYKRGYSIDRDDQHFCTVSDTDRENMGVNIESKSNCDYVIPTIKKWDHQVSRVDACIDITDPFFFEWANAELVKEALKLNPVSYTHLTLPTILRV